MLSVLMSMVRTTLTYGVIEWTVTSIFTQSLDSTAEEIWDAVESEETEKLSELLRTAAATDLSFKRRVRKTVLSPSYDVTSYRI
jgi:hypothetical protein